MHFPRLACKVIAFFLIFLCLFSAVSRVLTINPDDTLLEAYMTALFDEEPGSLDAVYIGSSNCVNFWNSLVAYEEYGIAVLPYAWASQPFVAAKHLILEARKTQPDALYIVNLNTISDVPGRLMASQLLAMHNVVDFMPLSLDKLKLTHYLTSITRMDAQESLEYYLPILRYHSRWSILGPANFQGKREAWKCSTIGESHFLQMDDFSEKYLTTDATAPLDPILEESLMDLLDYCDAEQVKVLFVVVPQAKGEEVVSQYNTIEEIALSRGYPVLDLLNQPEAMALDPSVDFSDPAHTNIHGSLKFTHYLAQYLMENYGFTDRREADPLSSWEDLLEEYREILAPWALDFELEGAPRTTDLAAPDVTVTAGENGNTLTWEAVSGTEGYAVYYKTWYDAPWMLLETTEDTAITHAAGLPAYTYTVVPYLLRDGQAVYGSFHYLGVTPDATE